MRKILGGMLLAGLFVLMLSALVVTPQDAEPPAVQQHRIRREAAFAPAIPAQRAETPSGVQVQSMRARPVSSLCTDTVSAAPAEGSRDANGRVLHAGRYESCVYQLFRAEVAGG